MGQININPGGSTEGGFGAGMIVGIVLLLIVILVVILYAWPQIFNPGTNLRSLLQVMAPA